MFKYVYLLFGLCLCLNPYADNPIHINVGPNVYHVEKENGNTKVIENITGIDYTNDLTIIQSVINYAALNKGGTVILSSGTFIIDHNLYMDDYIHLTGNGMSRTTLKMADYAPSFINGNIKKSGFIRAQFKKNIIISNMTLDGNKNNQWADYEHEYGKFGVFTEACNETWFDNLRVINFQGYGFDPHGKKPDKWGYNLFITNCIASGNGYDGFTLDQSINIVVENCESFNNSRHGFNVVTGSSVVIIKNSIAYDNGFNDPFGGSGCGFMVQNNFGYGAYNSVFKNNTAINNKKAGICVNDVYNVYLINNHVSNTCQCFEIINATTTLVAYNRCNTYNFIRYSNKDTNIKNLQSHAVYDQDKVYIDNNLYNQTDCYKYKTTKNYQQNKKNQKNTKKISGFIVIILSLPCIIMFLTFVRLIFTRSKTVKKLRKFVVDS